MANNIDVLDAAAATQAIKSTDNASVHTPHNNIDAVIPGTGATNLGKAEDAAHTTGDTGVMLLAVRNDTLSALAGTTGDYIPLTTDLLGKLQTNAGGNTVKNATTKVRTSDTNAYAAGDVINESVSAGTNITFAAIVRANNGSGIIQGAMIATSDQAADGAALELWLFDTTPTADNDQDAFTPTTAELGNLIGVIKFSTADIFAGTSATNGVRVANNLSVPFTCTGGVDDIYGVLVTRNAFTGVSAATYEVMLLVLQD